MSELVHFLEVCEAAARAGARELVRLQGRFKSREKGPKDLVTDADLASQHAIERTVHAAFPHHAFVGEEGSVDAAAGEVEYRWIVDPLDGTANYVHGLRPYAVSVALARGDELLAGVILDPTHDECFSARRGGGAWCNGERLRVSDCRNLHSAMMAASFAANVQRDSEEMRHFIEVSLECQSLRRLGSAALNLCYVAAGKLDAYWSTSVKSWDVAAGLLIVSEAGGVVTAADGSALQLDRPRMAVAATTQLHAELIAVLRRVS